VPLVYDACRNGACDIAGLQDLKELHLDRTLVSDAGAAIVKGMMFLPCAVH